MTRLLMTKTMKITLAMAVATAGNATMANPIAGAIGESKPIIDLRIRYEMVDQEPFTQDAIATTARARLGVETGKAWNTSLLLEGAFVGALQDDYNSTTNGNTTYPAVVDPKVTRFNRFQLTNSSITNTTITLGRQRINIDDQRFVGSVGWRQNEQTFDALRIITKPGGKLTIDTTYSNRVNRIFGENSTQGVYKGNFIFLNAAYPFAIGKLTAFGYFIDIDSITGVAAAVRDSTSTVGLRFAGQQSVGKVKVTYTASYATQKDYADNPLDFSNDYYLAEAGVTFRQWSAGIGVESLDGDGTKGFTTPLATLHKFQGWTDKFLGTPANGINDKYLNAGFATKGVGPFETVALTASYHSFDSTRLSQDLGSEIGAQVAAKWQRFTGLLKYADYSADSTTPAAYRDTKKLWAEIGFVW